MEIRPTTYEELLEKCFPLFAEYAAECSIPEIGKVDPQRAIYAALEDSGIMRSLAALYEGNITGFATILLPILPHYGKRVATVESIFVSRTFRYFGLGRMLMESIEATAKETGCVGILYSAPTGSQLERLLGISKRFRRTNSVFYRSL